MPWLFHQKLYNFTRMCVHFYQPCCTFMYRTSANFRKNWCTISPESLQIFTVINVYWIQTWWTFLPESMTIFSREPVQWSRIAVQNHQNWSLFSPESLYRQNQNDCLKSPERLLNLTRNAAQNHRNRCKILAETLHIWERKGCTFLPEQVYSMIQNIHLAIVSSLQLISCTLV